MQVQSRLFSDLTVKMNDKERREFERELDKKLKPHVDPWSQAVAAVKGWRRAGAKGRYKGPAFPDAPAPTGDENVDAILADEYQRINANYQGWLNGTIEAPGVYQMQVPVVPGAAGGTAPPISSALEG